MRVLAQFSKLQSHCKPSDGIAGASIWRCGWRNDVYKRLSFHVWPTEGGVPAINGLQKKNLVSCNQLRQLHI
jgi:hypothetical protein